MLSLLIVVLICLMTGINDGRKRDISAGGNFIMDEPRIADNHCSSSLVITLPAQTNKCLAMKYVTNVRVRMIFFLTPFLNEFISYI